MSSLLATLVLFMMAAGGSEPAPEPKPQPKPPTPPKPTPNTPRVVPPTPAPKKPAIIPVSWPTAAPKGLPPFPTGWEPDVPPPAAVTARAWALLPGLWKKGKGATAVEQTGGRWITYQAAVPSAGKKGVVAWRIKGNPPAGSPSTGVVTA